jgi:DNA repair protein RecN (Recombination protein N)
VLKFLNIQNIVLIDRAEINFSKGLCVLTGETGSGKSILLDALGLAIGFRSNLRLIGDDENKSTVNAEFDISKNLICQKILEENDLIDSQNPCELRIRRVIDKNSSSKAYINDNLVGINILAKIGESLVEIHGQHDQRGLLNSSAHIEILDDFAQNQDLLKSLKKNYDELREVEKKIAEIKSKKEQAQREKDYLEYVVRELEDASIKDNEEEELVVKKDQLIGKEKILNFLNDFKLHLLEANSQLISSQKILIRNQNIINNFLAEEKENFEKLSVEIDQQNSVLDASKSNVERLIREVSNSEDNLSEIEERLFYIRGLARKFNVRVDELMAIILDAQEKLKLLNNEEEFASSLTNQREKALKSYQKIADELDNKRQKSALILAKKVEEELKFLKMENVKFLVEVGKNSQEHLITPNGHNKVRFAASLNKNNFDDIAKIASGGELSRFMLALKVALMDVKSVPTMIFDEIDTGIGGSTADAVGRRLKILANNLQILVVTHQPQIAAKANTHFKISKNNTDKKIKTTIEVLNEKNREAEIARMLSGETISNEALAAASKLIKESS